MAASPALSIRSNFSDMDDEELEQYLASCVPLSSLPTPPPAKQQQHQQQQPLATSALPSPPAELDVQRHGRSPELEVYASHLASLVPRNVSGQKSSVPAIEEFLERACLPVEMIAFAACVLDALSDGFASRWRDAFLPMNTTRLDYYLGADCWRQPSVSPDLIVLAALALAHGFIDDRGRSNGHWAKVEGMGRFDAKEVGKTKMCILEDIDYGLFRIGDDMVQRMVRAMQHAAYITTPRTSVVWDDGDCVEKDGRRPRLSLSTGSGVADGDCCHFCAAAQRRLHQRPAVRLQGPLWAQFTRPKHKRTVTGFGPGEIKSVEASIPEPQRAAWRKFTPKGFSSSEEFEKEAVRHIETTLARSLYNCDESSAYAGTALAFRDRLILDWNKTQQTQTFTDQKRIYYLSLEFLMGRALDNAMLNVGQKDSATKGLDDLGFRMEDIISQEHDAALGNGGLGRLAACFLDSMASLNYPAWGYGLRYRYGIFKQEIIDGYQVEVPDYWLDFNPWEFQRHDITVDVQFYGHVNRWQDDEGKQHTSWEGGETVQAVAFDVPVPGYQTPTCNNLRLWGSKAASGEFDFQKFNSGEYEASVADQQRAETISAVLYPNDNLERGKELRLKQQYFWCAASLYDIVRRFKKTKRSWNEFPNQVAIQLNDTHPTLAIPELQRILIDLEGLEWDEAWNIVSKTFGYTNHTVLPEALEKWSVPLMQHLLPRHLQIIYDINLNFLQYVERNFPKDREMLSRVSIIEESNPKTVRMAYLALIGSHKVNGVAELHSDLIKTTIFKDFVKIYGPDKFTNVTNGITPRRWLHQANPRLSELIASKLGGHEFLKDLTLLGKLEAFVDDKEFRKEFREIKYANKVRLAKHIKEHNGVTVNPAALFDVQVKRIHEYKRQQLNVFGVIHRYLQIKSMSEEEKKKLAPRVSIFAGKAAPGYWMAKTVIHLINKVGDVVNNDPDVGDLLKVIFLGDYNVSKAEIITPASDISEHISTAGTEASGTSNMKFCLNGGLIIGTCDGANIEITREIGEQNIFLFGNLAEDVDDLRHAHLYNHYELEPGLAKVFDEIHKGRFGDAGAFTALINGIVEHGDYYLVSDDFASYVQTQELIDEAYKNTEEWTTKAILTVARMGFFSSDRCIDEYAESIWNIEPLVPGKEDAAE
ncbi:Non-essential glycogen phosphorylase [Kalmusia sp. IMI 367209]|nr:Non-essential glycogen phosphorylase [Kalmusia sp. IMI 367209]